MKYGLQMYSVRDVTARDLEAYKQKRGFSAEQTNLFLSHLDVVE